MNLTLLTLRPRLLSCQSRLLYSILTSAFLFLQTLITTSSAQPNAHKLAKLRAPIVNESLKASLDKGETKRGS
jgi:hypothetical protein